MPTTKISLIAKLDNTTLTSSGALVHHYKLFHEHGDKGIFGNYTVTVQSTTTPSVIGIVAGKADSFGMYHAATHAINPVKNANQLFTYGTANTTINSNDVMYDGELRYIGAALNTVSNSNQNKTPVIHRVAVQSDVLDGAPTVPVTITTQPILEQKDSTVTEYDVTYDNTINSEGYRIINYKIVSPTPGTLTITTGCASTPNAAGVAAAGVSALTSTSNKTNGWNHYSVRAVLGKQTFSSDLSTSVNNVMPIVSSVAYTGYDVNHATSLYSMAIEPGILSGKNVNGIFGISQIN